MSDPEPSSLFDEHAAERAAGFIRQAFGLAPADCPRVGVILGSGLGAAVDRLLDDSGLAIDYKEIPGMPVPNVSGHAGRLVLARIGGIRVVILQGRVHYYEGHSAAAIVFGARVLSCLGIGTLIVTNAAGGISAGFSPGDLMLINSHLRPLAAKDLDIGGLLANPCQKTGQREPLHSCLWNRNLLCLATAVPTTLRVHEGVYAMMTGPAYETPAEIRMMRILGADAVGMSSVPEAIFAASRGIHVLGVSCITNVAAGLSAKTLDHHDVTATAASIEIPFVEWLRKVVRCL